MTINGFSEEEIKELIFEVKEAKEHSENLTSVFEKFAIIHSRAFGSVRNFYYFLLDKISQDRKLKEYLFGLDKELKAEKIIPFSEDETIKLVRYIIKGQFEGKSVRSLILKYADGDEKLMLRYQNKYRHILKCRPELINFLKNEVLIRKEMVVPNYDVKIPEILSKRLMNEIDNLLHRTRENLKKENDDLRNKLKNLEQENFKLKKADEGYKILKN